MCVLLLSAIGLVDKAIRDEWVIFPDQIMREAISCRPGSDLFKKYMKRTYGLQDGESKAMRFCSGYDDYDPGYANLQMNRIHFRIPRKYMTTHGEADGPAAYVRLEASFPDIDLRRPGEEYVKIQLVRIRSHFACENNSCMSKKQEFYFGKFIVVSSINVIDSFDKIASYARNHSIDTIDSNYKKIQSVDGYVLFKGDFFSPDYWLECKKSICQTHFWLDDNVYVRYRIKQDSMFEHHEAIYENLTQKISEFRVDWNDKS